MRTELARVIQERVGLDEATALQVADVAIEFLKSKLPPELASVVDGQAPDLSSLSGALGGMLGKSQG